jgi:hypothetical protein
MPIHNILSTAPQLSISQKVLGMLPEDGNVMPKRRNCLLKQIIEGKIKGEMKVTRRRGIRRKKLLDDLKDRRGYSHLK